ncbi:transposase [Komarekiella sp. 'clone 1']|uniref:Transposase n=1 Tax=Komarekiella delphini-convector SJRDD-AB1 TaxID=2593771 RepID=A0AA40T3X7_9NOST|nr:transposase [Komarekiella delphini-convector]MBD6620225.1 transposase [Komarekiella delphini-convector SJRDD-AB1]
MPYDPRKHRRRSIRLKGYDYTQPGAYFITLCTHGRQCLFGNVVKGKMQLNYLGHIAFNCWEAIPDHFPHIELDTFVVMPNHLHGILVITDTSVGAWHCHAHTREQFGKPVRGSIPTVIGSYKSAVSKSINVIWHTKGQSIWQRNFYEHISRDQKSLDHIRQYILDNPQRWADDPDNSQQNPDDYKFLFDIPF